jgi:hypothetical protein
MRAYPSHPVALIALLLWAIAWAVGLAFTYYAPDPQRSINIWSWVSVLSFPAYQAALFPLQFLPAPATEALSRSLLAQWGIAVVVGYVQWFICVPLLLQLRSSRRASNSAPHRDGREASRLGQTSSAPARGRER